MHSHPSLFLSLSVFPPVSPFPCSVSLSVHLSPHWVHLISFKGFWATWFSKKKKKKLPWQLFGSLHLPSCWVYWGCHDISWHIIKHTIVYMCVTICAHGFLALDGHHAPTPAKCSDTGGKVSSNHINRVQFCSASLTLQTNATHNIHVLSNTCLVVDANMNLNWNIH